MSEDQEWTDRAREIGKQRGPIGSLKYAVDLEVKIKDLEARLQKSEMELFQSKNSLPNTAMVLWKERALELEARLGRAEADLSSEKSYKAENYCPYGGHATDGSTCRYCHWKARPEPGALVRQVIERIRCEFSATAMNAGEETGYCDTCAGFSETGWNMNTENKILDKFKSFDALEGERGGA